MGTVAVKIQSLGTLLTIVLNSLFCLMLETFGIPGKRIFRVVLSSLLDSFIVPFLMYLLWDLALVNLTLYKLPKLSATTKIKSKIGSHISVKALQLLLNDYSIVEGLLFASSTPDLITVVVYCTVRSTETIDSYFWIWPNIFTLLNALYQALPGSNGSACLAALTGSSALFSGGTGWVLFLIWSYIRLASFIVLLVLVVLKAMKLSKIKSSVNPTIIAKPGRRAIDDSSEQSLFQS